MIQPILTRLNKKSKAVVAARDHHLQLLTNDERLKVGAWIIQCADGQKPKDRTEVSEKIIEILKARARANREKGYGKGTVLLNEPEKAAAKSLPGHKLTKTFFTNFYAWLRAHGVGIDEGVDRSQDAKRAAKMTGAPSRATSTANTASCRAARRGRDGPRHQGHQGPAPPAQRGRVAAAARPAAEGPPSEGRQAQGQAGLQGGLGQQGPDLGDDVLGRRRPQLRRAAHHRPHDAHRRHGGRRAARRPRVRRRDRRRGQAVALLPHLAHRERHADAVVHRVPRAPERSD